MTRGAAKSDREPTTMEPPTLQGIDDKLNTILGMLDKNSSDINDIKKEQRDLGTSIELCHNNISDLKNMFGEQNLKISNCEEDIVKLKQENNKLNGLVLGLKDDLNNMEQYSHRNNLVIYGIPEEKSENIFNILRRLAHILHFPDWSNNLVDAVHRMGHTTPHNPRPIIIKFVSRLARDEFLAKRKVKRNLRAAELGYSSENLIYVNESLTTANRELLRMTRETAKQKNYSQVWTSNCSIYVRKERGKSPVIKITSVRDLSNL